MIRLQSDQRSYEQTFFARLYSADNLSFSRTAYLLSIYSVVVTRSFISDVNLRINNFSLMLSSVDAYADFDGTLHHDVFLSCQCV